MSALKGIFYGVGVGPGDPKLLTIRAVEVLQTVEVIAIPKSRLDKESVAWDIAKTHCREGVRLIELEMPMTNDKQILKSAWEKGAQMLAKEIDSNKSVAFITLGDPSLYSTYSYLLVHLRKIITDLRVETVPGITAMTAAAAKTNTPLATGDEPLLILPSAEDLDGFMEFPNLVLMKVSRRLPKLLASLSERDKKTVLVTRVGQKGEEIKWNPQAIDYEDKIDYLSLLLVREGGEKSE